MAVELLDGHVTWSMEQDEDSHREYVVVHKVRADRLDGPFAVSNCPGLPEEGSVWNFDNELDVLAWCKFDKKVTPMVPGEANEYWLVESKFSTKPVDKCRDEPILDPLQEPDKISGGVVKYTEEGISDATGRPILNSAHEVIRGPQNEWDASRSTVRVVQNVADLELPVLDKYIDRLNEGQMWGLGIRQIKFSNYSWEQKFHGFCDVYYTRTLEFEIRREGFDRSILDEGTKVLNGHWDHTTGDWVNDAVGGFAPNYLNPTHFMRAVDPQGNPIRAILDGAGNPFVPNAAEVLKFWCVDNGVDFFVQEDTCSGVQTTAWYWGAYVKGPYNTEAEADAVCSEEADEDPATGSNLLQAPDDLICVGAPNEPARIRVKKYLQGDLLTKLRLPTTIG